MKIAIAILLLSILLISCWEEEYPTENNRTETVTWDTMSTINWQFYQNLWIQSLIKNSENVLFAATGSSIFRSQDEGTTWHKLGLEIMSGCKLVINSKDWIYAYNNSSLYLSKDNGDEWEKIGSGSRNIFISPNDDIYMGNSIRNMKSTDDGASWSLINLDGWATGFYFSEPNTIYGCISFGGIYKSDDNGITWESISGNLRLNQNESDIRTMDVDFTGTIYIGTPDGLFRKKMNENNWQRVELLNSYIYSVKACGNGITFVAADTLGVYYTNDNGTNWKKNIEGLVTPRVYDFLEYKNEVLVSINVIGEWSENMLFKRKLYY